MSKILLLVTFGQQSFNCMAPYRAIEAYLAISEQKQKKYDRLKLTVHATGALTEKTIFCNYAVVDYIAINQKDNESKVDENVDELILLLNLQHSFSKLLNDRINLNI